MSWWTGKKDEELPAELRDKKPEELVEAVKNSARASELEKTASEAQTENDRLKERIRALEANAEPPERRSTPKQPTSVLADEDAAFNERLKPVVDIALQATAMSARSAARDSLKARDRYMWDKFSSDIDAIMAKEPLERRAIPQNWIAALTFVKGIKVDDISKPDFFSELSTADTTVGGTRTDGGTHVDEEKLTPAEEATCKHMRIDPKVYLEQRNAMRKDNRDWAPGQHA